MISYSTTQTKMRMCFWFLFFVMLCCVLFVVELCAALLRSILLLYFLLKIWRLVRRLVAGRDHLQASQPMHFPPRMPSNLARTFAFPVAKVVVGHGVRGLVQLVEELRLVDCVH